MKKVYCRPTLAVHGGATEQTRGRNFGYLSDFFASFRWIPS